MNIQKPIYMANNGRKISKIVMKIANRTFDEIRSSQESCLKESKKETFHALQDAGVEYVNEYFSFVDTNKIKNRLATAISINTCPEINDLHKAMMNRINRYGHPTADGRIKITPPDVGSCLCFVNPQTDYEAFIRDFVLRDMNISTKTIYAVIMNSIKANQIIEEFDKENSFMTPMHSMPYSRYCKMKTMLPSYDNPDLKKMFVVHKEPISSFNDLYDCSTPLAEMIDDVFTILKYSCIDFENDILPVLESYDFQKNISNKTAEFKFKIDGVEEYTKFIKDRNQIADEINCAACSSVGFAYQGPIFYGAKIYGAMIWDNYNRVITLKDPLDPNLDEAPNYIGDFQYDHHVDGYKHDFKMLLSVLRVRDAINHGVDVKFGKLENFDKTLKIFTDFIDLHHHMGDDVDCSIFEYEAMWELAFRIAHRIAPNFVYNSLISRYPNTLIYAAIYFGMDFSEMVWDRLEYCYQIVWHHYSTN